MLSDMNGVRDGSDNAVRREEVLDYLKRQTSASIAEIAARFQVSAMTVRRDLETLVQAGQVIRIPSGAMVAPTTALEKTFTERQRRMADAKHRIGKAAAELILEGQAVVLDSGTTTLQIASQLRRRKNLVVFTFSLAVLEELMNNESVRVELTGGVYRHSSHDLIGNAVAESLAGIHADKIFFGAATVSFSHGVMVYDPEYQRALLESGKERVLVVDSSKIGAEAIRTFCPIKKCDLIITDSGVKPSHLKQLEKITRVLVAE